MRLDIRSRQPQCHALLGHITSPYTVCSSTPPFLARGVFATTARRLAKQNLEIALLRRQPALEECDGVLGHAGEEGMLGLGLTNRTHEQHELLVDLLNLLQRLNAVWPAQNFLEQWLHRVLERYLDIVDGGLRRGLTRIGRRRVIVLVHTDRVLQLDRWEGREMGLNELRQVWKVERILAAEKRLKLRVACEFALVILLLQVLRSCVLPDAHQDASAVLFVCVQ
jgi:hypothetical protein